jgi:leader peptidase (prepilin peptidase)/N-methyltransferase
LAAGAAAGALTAAVVTITPRSPRTSRWAAAAAAALVAVLTTARFPWPNRAVPLVALAALTAWGAAVDIARRRLPDVMTLGGGAVVVAVHIAACVAAGHPGRVVAGVAGVALYAGPLLVVRLARPDDFGFGDVKFGVPLGFALGWFHPAMAVVGLFVSFVTGLAMLAVTPREERVRRSIPFGAAMAVAVTATLLVFGSLLSG